MTLEKYFSKEFIKSLCEHMNYQPDEESEDLKIELVDAAQFLTSKRFDLVCKLYYIDCREHKRDVAFAKKLYESNIISITGGTCREEWNPAKSSIEGYIKVFDELIDHIKENGFDQNKSVVPVANDGNILDGAHRVAIAIYYHLPLPIVRLNCRSWGNDYKSFSCGSQFDMSEEYLDFTAYQYLEYKEPGYIAIIWPISHKDPNYDIAVKLLEENCSVVYKKQVRFNYSGFTQFVMHNYMDTDWAGGLSAHLPGIHVVVNERYAEGQPVTILQLDGEKLEEIVKLKWIIRTVLHEGFCKIHITDTQHEAIRMAKLLYNQNSIDFLNNSNFIRYDSFIQPFLEFRKAVLENGYEDDVCADTGGVLGIYGLRETNDIDYLSQTDEDLPGLEAYDRHTQEYYSAFKEEIVCKDIVEQWNKHYYCFDIMFASIDTVREFKSSRNEPKDKVDVALIDKMDTQSPYRAPEIPKNPKKKRLTVRMILGRIKRAVLCRMRKLFGKK